MYDNAVSRAPVIPSIEPIPAPAVDVIGANIPPANPAAAPAPAPAVPAATEAGLIIDRREDTAT